MIYVSINNNEVISLLKQQITTLGINVKIAEDEFKGKLVTSCVKQPHAQPFLM